MSPTLNSLSVNDIHSFEKSSIFSNDSQDICLFNLGSKGINIGNLNIQGICGDRMSKFSEITSVLISPVNNKLHIFGMSETKWKGHKHNDVFKIKGFQLPFRKDNNTNGGGGIIVYVLEGIDANRREHLDRVKRIWYLSPMRAVSPEPPLLTHTNSESRGTFGQKARSLASLNGWTCAVTICHDGMLEDTNSLDGAH